MWLLVLSSYFPSGWEWDTHLVRMSSPFWQTYAKGTRIGVQQDITSLNGQRSSLCTQVRVYTHTSTLETTWEMGDLLCIITGVWDRVHVQMHNPQMCLFMARGKAFSATTASTEIPRKEKKIRLLSAEESECGSTQFNITNWSSQTYQSCILPLVLSKTKSSQQSALQCKAKQNHKMFKCSHQKKIC